MTAFKNSSAEEMITDHGSYLTSATTKLAAKYPAALPLPVPKTPDPFQSSETNECLVCVRSRPLLTDEIKSGAYNAITVSNPDVHVHSIEFKSNGAPTLNTTDYKVDIAFDEESTNDQVYSTIAKPLIPWVLQGGIATIFAFGQTGSGKTHTMTGIEENLAQDIFRFAQEKQNAAFSVYVSFIEIYQNLCFDLCNNHAKVVIMEDSLGAVEIRGAAETLVTTTSEFLQIVRKGSTQRRTESTSQKHTSSRSHAICKVRVVNDRMSELKDGLFYLVDLAGSASTADTKFNNKKRDLESRNINESLVTLIDCIKNRATSATSSKRHVHIPYRRSKLTLLLKDVFELASLRPSRTVVIANVASSVFNTQQSLNTLRSIAPLKVPIPEVKVLKKRGILSKELFKSRMNYLC